MAIKIICCSGRDKSPPIAYKGSIMPEALEISTKLCPLLSVMLKELMVEKSSNGDISPEKNNCCARG